jgi:hypothetical protein
MVANSTGAVTAQPFAATPDRRREQNRPKAALRAPAKFVSPINLFPSVQSQTKK